MIYGGRQRLQRLNKTELVDTVMELDQELELAKKSLEQLEKKVQDGASIGRRLDYWMGEAIKMAQLYHTALIHMMQMEDGRI